MVIRETRTDTLYEAVIEPMKSEDFLTVREEKDRFDKFNWEEYKRKEVYKLRLKESDMILGMICLTDHKDATINAIEIELLEVSEENIGPKKKYDYIAGCLLAFACRQSFKQKHDGCVFLIPKSELVDHYVGKYGFFHLPIKSLARPAGIVVLFEDGSTELIKKYLDPPGVH